MRKALKGFRYAVEFFGSLYDARKVGRFVKDLKKLQDVFGYVNDVASAKALDAIAEERCAGCLEAQRAAGYVRGWHEVSAQQAWGRAANDWCRLAKRPRFWE
jgi:CHAD domain-containing protein